MNNIKLFKITIKIILLIVISFTQAHAQNLTNLDELHFVADIDNTLPNAVYSNDAAIINFNLSTNTASNNNDLGALDSAGIDGFHRTGDGCGDTIYSVDTTIVVNSVAVLAADVFTATGVKVLNSRAAGIPDGINVDAISRDPASCDLVISIDSTSSLGGTAYIPSDLIRWDGSIFSLYQATGFKANIDALHILSANRLLISIEDGGALPDINGFDDDVFEISTQGSAFQILAFEAQMFDSSWQAADINALWAVPTPIIDFMFADGFE